MSGKKSGTSPQANRFVALHFLVHCIIKVGFMIRVATELYSCQDNRGEACDALDTCT